MGDDWLVSVVVCDSICVGAWVRWRPACRVAGRAGQWQANGDFGGGEPGTDSGSGKGRSGSGEDGTVDRVRGASSVCVCVFFVSRMTEQWFIIRDREAERVQVELLHAGLAKVLSFRWSVKTRVDDCAVQAVRGEMVL